MQKAVKSLILMLRIANLRRAVRILAELSMALLKLKLGSLRGESNRSL